MTKKKKFTEMKIRSPEDVVALVNWNTAVFDARSSKLAKRCKSAKLLSLIAIVGICAVYIETKKQEEELYKLSVRIKKLENKEEE